MTNSPTEIARRPVLIVGAPRSGTTWLQRLLLGDRRCAGGQESHFFVSFGRVLHDFDRKAGSERPHGLACYWKRQDLIDTLRDLWLRTTRECLAAQPKAHLLIEKTPDHAEWIDIIDELFPATRFIHMVRDSRAVCASLLSASRASWGASWAPRSVTAAIAKWVSHVRAAETSGERLGSERFLRVHYEDLHTHPAETLERTFSFLGLATSRDQLEDLIRQNEFTSQAGGGGAPFKLSGELAGRQVAEPAGFFRKGSPDAWRQELNWFTRRLIWKRTAGLMEQLGYDRSGRRSR